MRGVGRFFCALITLIALPISVEASTAVSEADLKTVLGAIDQHCSTALATQKDFNNVQASEPARITLQKLVELIQAESTASTKDDTTTSGAGSKSPEQQKAEPPEKKEKSYRASLVEGVTTLFAQEPSLLKKIGASNRKILAACAQQALAESNRRERFEIAKDPNSTAATNATKSNALANDSYVTLAQELTLQQAQVALLLGPNFNITSKGGWEAGGGEALLRFDAGPRSFFAGRSFTEISYQKIGAIDADTTDEKKVASLKNPFASDQGFFRINSGVIFCNSCRHGFLVSGGLTSIDTSKSTDTANRVEPRASIGIQSSTFFTDKSYSQFFVGYAYDHFWEYEKVVGSDTSSPQTRHDFHRAIVDGTWYLPQISTGKLQGALRLFVDTPIGRRGPSDIRASILVFFDINNFMGLINPLVTQATIGGNGQ